MDKNKDYLQGNLGKILRVHFQNPGPLLVYDLHGIAERMLALKKLSSRYHCQFLMACKSFPHPKIINLANEFLGGFDISNENEFAKIPHKGKDKILWLTNPTGNIISKKANVIVTIDDLEQLKALQNIKRPLQYALRLNSNLLLGPRYTSQSLKSLQPPINKWRFGLRPSELKSLIKIIHSLKHQFIGLHMHHASERNTPEHYLALANQAMSLMKEVNLDFHILNLGGGLHCLPMEQIESLLKALRKEIPKGIEIYFEPGRFLSQDFGHACGQVQALKQFKRGKALYENYTLNLSALCHLQWSHPRLVTLSPSLTPTPGLSSKESTHIRFYGPTCYENDCLGDFQFQFNRFNRSEYSGRSHYSTGQTIIFNNISGYSFALNNGFNGIPPAQVYFLE